jgi:hypothetical protein
VDLRLRDNRRLGGGMEINITIQKPDIDCTQEEFREWLYYELGYSGSIKMDNPLADEQLEITDINY